MWVWPCCYELSFLPLRLTHLVTIVNAVFWSGWMITTSDSGDISSYPRLDKIPSQTVGLSPLYCMASRTIRVYISVVLCL